MPKHQKNIELEFRAVVPIRLYNKLHRQLHQRYTHKRTTRRLSVMFFGKVENEQVDIRVRITNGDAEVVVKRGRFGAHNRTEKSVPIKTNQFLEFVRFFVACGFTQTQHPGYIPKVAERFTHDFSDGKGTVLSLVRAGSIVYLEVERMSTILQVPVNKQKVLKHLQDLKLKPINDKQFVTLCKKLSKQEDWTFRGTPNQHRRLAKLLREYI